MHIEIQKQKKSQKLKQVTDQKENMKKIRQFLKENFNKYIYIYKKNMMNYENA